MEQLFSRVLQIDASGELLLDRPLQKWMATLVPE